MSPVNIIVAGAGLIGQRHIELVMQSPECGLAGVVETSGELRRQLSDRGVPVFETLSDAFAAAPRPDLGVIIATPNHAHAGQALQCIQEGLPTLVEKPLADTVVDAERIVAAAGATGVPVLVGHHRRHGAYATAARKVVDSGRLGSITAVTASILFYKPDEYFDSAPWRAKPGGGPILINLIHEIDLLRALCGEVTAVQAISSSATRGFSVEDTAAIGLRFASGALATIMLSDVAASSRSWEQTSRENPEYPFVPATDCYVIAGTAGSLSIPTMRLETYQSKASWWEPLHSEFLGVTPIDPHARQLQHFCEVIRGTKAPLVSGREGLESLRATLAVAEAARTGRTLSPREFHVSTHPARTARQQ